jgi:hypothetical protein
MSVKPQEEQAADYAHWYQFSLFPELGHFSFSIKFSKGKRQVVIQSIHEGYTVEAGAREAEDQPDSGSRMDHGAKEST